MHGTKGLDGAELRRGLTALAAEWGVPCSDQQAAELGRYATLLLTWNEHINLTGARSSADLITDHFPDSFALAASLAGPEQIIDVGTGGGLPAVPLAILRPALALVLCEPLKKKGAFLRTGIRELGLATRVRLEVRHGEDLAAEAPRSFDAAFSRATLAPPDWLALGRRLVRPGGRVFVLTTPETSLAADQALPIRSRRYSGGRRVLVEVTVP